MRIIACVRIIIKNWPALKYKCPFNERDFEPVQCSQCPVNFK
jgi:hypothetical protein